MAVGVARNPRLGLFLTHDILRFATLVAIAVFLVDWAAKSWALHALQDTAMPLGALMLDVERNDAFAFSSGAGRFTPEVIFLVRLIGLVAVLTIARHVALRRRRYAAGFALLVGGGFGNAADLIFREGAVVDFIGAGPFSFELAGELRHVGFVFNTADLAILLGLALLAPQIQEWSLRTQRRLARWEERWLWSNANA